MDLRSAFTQALPSPDWASSSRAQVVVALFDLDDWRPWLAEAVGLLDPLEQTRVQRRRVSTDRDALALTYALHRLLLGAALAQDPAAIPLYRDESGCPRVQGGQVYTSLSHSEGHAAVAVTSTGPVGVDIELASRAAVMAEIAGRICHPDEAAALADLVEPGYGEALLRLWVGKEAALKAAGIGMAREMDSFALAEEGALWAGMTSDAATRLHRLDAGPDWVAALAGPSGVPVACAWLRPR